MKENNLQSTNKVKDKTLPGYIEGKVEEFSCEFLKQGIQPFPDIKGKVRFGPFDSKQN